MGFLMIIREVLCPACRVKFNYFSSEFRPFCCEKCRLIDLGQWLDESYRVPAEKMTEDELIMLEQINQEIIPYAQEDEDSIQ